MITAVQPDVCDPVVSLGWITRQAESQVAQLCPMDQARIVETLLKPLPRRRCELVESLAQYRIYHFRASKTLRVSYRPTDKGLCIVHVGKHSEFDRFARHFAGQPPIHLVPLQESVVMKNNQQFAKNNAVKSTPAQSNVAPATPVTGDEEFMLLESLRDLISKAVTPRQEALASDWGTRLDDVRKEMEQRSQESCQRLAQHDARLNGLGNECRAKLADLGRQMGETCRSQQDLAAKFAQSRTDLDGRCEAQSRALEEVHSETARRADQANAAWSEMEKRLAALTGRLESLSQETDTRVAGVAECIEKHHDADKTVIYQFGGRISGVEQTIGSQGETLTNLATTAQEQQRTIVALETALAELSSQLGEMTAAAKKPRSWWHLWDWARRFRLMSPWNSLRRKWRGQSGEPHAAGTARFPLRRRPRTTTAHIDSAHVESGAAFDVARRG